MTHPSHDPHADPDMLRRVTADTANLERIIAEHGFPGQRPPCEHRWRYVDTFDVFYCLNCKITESPDDPPPETAA